MAKSARKSIERILTVLRRELAELGYARDFLIMNGNGGMISAEFVTGETIVGDGGRRIA